MITPVTDTLDPPLYVCMQVSCARAYTDVTSSSSCMCEYVRAGKREEKPLYSRTVK